MLRGTRRDPTADAILKMVQNPSVCAMGKQYLTTFHGTSLLLATCKPAGKAPTKIQNWDHLLGGTSYLEPI